ncbi:ankyrin repeat domain-containing protein [Polymorphospora sp. NPDC050346]|uniref:ankyrin repeat domain-containing protein n=1 Tax=Polymorphospora sp. NPDC050346 TaxID=3155780 RepID=UPI0033ED6382
MLRRSHREKHARNLGYLSPPAMVAAVADRRRAGDWRGVCAAGLVDVHVDPRDVAARFGAEQAAAIEADLLGFAPDLLRRFAPRTASLELWPRARIVLSRLAGAIGDRAVLVADLPAGERFRQRIELRVLSAAKLDRPWYNLYDLPDWCWHADAVAARRWAYGASATRLAWHDPDGRPYPPGVAVARRPADRADEVEVLAELLETGQVTAAYEAAGRAVDPKPPPRWYGGQTLEPWLARFGASLPVLAAESRRLAGRYARPSLRALSQSIAVDVADDGGLTVRMAAWERDFAGPIAFGVAAPVDVALLRRGALRVDDLHPLVHEALFPGQPRTPPAPVPVERPVIRIRCGGQWHPVRVTGARITTLEHSEREIDREFTLAVLGGPIGGCAAAVRAFRTGAKPVPKDLRRIRQDLFALAFHGDTDTLLAIVAAGLDPGLRDSDGGTLMHWLHHLDHRRALPVLLAAGLAVTDHDRNGDTPLHRAAASGAADVVAALVEAGADPGSVDGRGRTAAQVLAQARRGSKR